MLKVLIVDDHAVVRRGVIQILSELPDLEITEAGSGREALQAIRQARYDLMILDVALPDTSGLDLLEQVKKISPSALVLILSMYPEHQYAIRALRAGASGYLTKDSAPTELITAIRRIAQGGKYVSTALAELLATELNIYSDKKPHEILSDREYQVMMLLASGKTVSEISSELSLSVKTVSTYRSRILEKLKLHNTAEIIRYALQHNLA